MLSEAKAFEEATIVQEEQIEAAINNGTAATASSSY